MFYNINLFDNIAQDYDKVNEIIFLKTYTYWRKQVGKFLPKTSTLVDIATGTAKQIIALPKIENTIGIDISPNMLEEGSKNLKKAGYKAELLLGNVHAIPLQNNFADCVTFSFGSRFVDVKKAVKEIHRILKPGGISIILELSNPACRPLKFYIKQIIGRFNFWQSTYIREYLDMSVENSVDISQQIKLSGFRETNLIKLTFNTANIYINKK